MLTEDIQKSIDYIENNLKNDILLTDCARASGYSLYYYCRVFQLATGMTVMDYIRARRLTNAAMDIYNTSKCIKEIVFDWGFNSHEHFNRIFNRNFGISPTAYRKSRYSLDLFKEIHLNECKSLIKTEEELNIIPRIERIESLKIAGKMMETSHENRSHLKDIPRFLNRYYSEKYWSNIPGQISSDKRTDYYLSVDFEKEGSTFNFLIGTEVSEQSDVPKEITCRTVPEGEYAIFTTPRSDNFNMISMLKKTWKHIALRWLPETNYQHVGTHEIIAYCPHVDQYSKDIYIPIIEKQNWEI